MYKFIPITADVITSTDAMTREFETELKKVGNAIRNDLMKPTETWEDKPTFVSKIKVTPQEVSMDIYLAGDTPGNQHYEWLDEGVAEHDVSPKGEVKGKLPGTFSSKTLPGTLDASAGGSSDEFTFVPINYPLVSGIEARNFINTVVEIWEKKFPDSAIRIMRKVEKDLSG